VVAGLAEDAGSAFMRGQRTLQWQIDGGTELGSRCGGHNKNYVGALRHFVLLRKRSKENKEFDCRKR